MSSSVVKNCREKVTVEHSDFDWYKVEGNTLKNAANYLLELSERLPPHAFIDEHWYGYEDMEIRVLSYRDETDEELDKRLKQEEIDQERIREELKRSSEREKRRQEYLELKKEFGHLL